ncbi:electron transport complex, RnfABCDGE type, A subunit [Leptotrichia sp. oral taxon 215 str. W9775]|jgi:electron transport complex, rnfABCDGE type, A subunit|uniref:electron transport complex protein RnfA n=1 Tax=Leptotrichia sp. oral taxon 215 TaxID=712359 RepID=UPI0003AD9479|nr:RnfABCDGE type electron transport complex subunit A [Leptotrichia sp. oral taxon 215]ERK66593.1 electron transport complex, RnfABCDGE type, A subunit [Leptotrichia sp. oral taxon 215 str. W9775]MBF1336200.1 RnfABCDGE type electron transport complex subunit A [Leptotrichia sp.]
MELVTLFISAVLINNIILTKYLGVCPFLGVSKSVKSSFGMGLAVIFVIFSSSVITYGLYYTVLVPYNMEYLDLITFILVIASLVQFVEMVIKKFSPTLYKALGVYLPLITTNCAVLGTALLNIREGYTFAQMLVNSIAVPVGFMLVMLIFATIRERLELSKTPEHFKGNAISLIVAALMAMIMLGFAGVV